MQVLRASAFGSKRSRKRVSPRTGVDGKGEKRTYLDLLGSRNGYDIVALREEPRERDLPWRRVVLGCDGLYGVDKRKYGREVLLRESIYGR